MLKCCYVYEHWAMHRMNKGGNDSVACSTEMVAILFVKCILCNSKMTSQTRNDAKAILKRQIDTHVVTTEYQYYALL